jgi:two-component system chemotaxis response regulator CheY
MRLKALVIDDSGIMRKMVMKSLTEAKLADFEFVEAVDGADALAKFDPQEIGIAFVDWNMPNMTGVDFVRAVRAKLRAQDYTEDLPMVMVTSEKTMAKIQEALDEAGADAFITKPFTTEELARKLKKVVDKAQLVHIRRLREERVLQAQQQPASGGLFNKLFG